MNRFIRNYLKDVVMKLLKAIGVLVVSTGLILGGATAVYGSVTPTPVGAGHDIYSGGSYRYGPSFIRNADGSIDMWTCSPGGGGSWDYIRYSHSTDDGATFNNEQVVLQPTTTSGSEDIFSTCDPGVVAFGGYYYIAYTSTKDASGQHNNVFVARSTSPTGPFDKWNGSGWGGSPQPFISYTGTDAAYGDGEPSLVVKDSTLFIYYSEYSTTSNRTMVATASTSNPNWPGAITQRGVSIVRDGLFTFTISPPAAIQDSTDHKYIPSLGKFIAIDAAQRFSTGFYLQVYESTDGITYTPTTQITQGLAVDGHNAGITGDALGQLDPQVHNYVGYAYGTSWGSWNTWLQPIDLADVSTSVSIEKDNSTGLTFTNYSDIHGNVERLQPFTVTGTTLPRLDLWLYRNGSPSGNLFLRIYALDAAGHLSGLPLYTKQLAPGAVPSTPGGVSFYPGLVNLTPGGLYGFTLSSTDTLDSGGTSDSYGFGYNDAGLYPAHSESYSINGGSAWTSEANRTLRFVTYTGSTASQVNSGGSNAVWSDVARSVERLQTFSLTSSNLRELDILVGKPGVVDGDLQVQIFAADSSGNPAGAAIYTNHIPPSLVPSGTSWLRLYPNLVGLAPGSYAYILSGPGVSASSSSYTWAYSDANTYSNGVERYSTDGGASWNTESNRDMKFISYQ